MSTEKKAKPVEIPADFSVAERRLMNGDLAELSRGSDIELANQPEPMVTYWSPINGSPTPWDMVNRLGWRFVTPADLPGKPEELGVDVQDGRIVKGGQDDQEVLFKMPKRLREAIQRKKTVDFDKRRQSESQYKSMLQKGLSDSGDGQTAELLGKMEGTLEGGRSLIPARAQETEQPEPVR